jgi:hypothetical protein
MNNELSQPEQVGAEAILVTVQERRQDAMRAYNLQTLSEIVQTEYKENVPIVEHLLGPGETTLLIARQKEGKSTLALQLAIDLSNGDPFLGQYKTRRSCVAYVDYENRPHRIKTRAIDVAKGRPTENVIVSAFDSISDRDLTLFADGYERLVRVVAEIKPQVLIIDPLRLAIEKDSSDERSAVDALDHVAKLRRQNPELTVLLIHHVKKAQSNDNLIMDLRVDPRSWVDKIYGSQALLAHAENIWGLEHDQAGYVFGTVSRSEESFVIALEKEPDSQRFKVSDQPAQIANLPHALREAWELLPQDFSRSEGTQLRIPNSTLDRLIRQTRPIGLLIQDPKTKRYRKSVAPKVGEVGNKQK